MRTESVRPDYDDWFMEMCRTIANRSSCVRRAVGCLIVSVDHRILSMGYNGVPHGVEHCTTKECPGAGMRSGEGLDMCQALHAEQNAVARLRDVAEAHTIYCTTSPCISCTKLLSATNAIRIVAGDFYPKSGRVFWTENLGREWRDIGLEEIGR